RNHSVSQTVPGGGPWGGSRRGGGWARRPRSEPPPKARRCFLTRLPLWGRSDADRQHSVNLLCSVLPPATSDSLPAGGQATPITPRNSCFQKVSWPVRATHLLLRSSPRFSDRDLPPEVEHRFPGRYLRPP